MIRENTFGTHKTKGNLRTALMAARFRLAIRARARLSCCRSVKDWGKDEVQLRPRPKDASQESLHANDLCVVAQLSHRCAEKRGVARRRTLINLTS